MTPTEIEAVTRAWEADPQCRPACVMLADLPGMPHVALITRDALHRRLLELGAFVQPAAGNGYLVYNQTNQGSIAWSPDSLIIAMARGIIALAKENP